MPTPKNLTHLRLVSTVQPSQVFGQDPATGGSIQGTLFPLPHPNSVWFADAGALESTSFVDFLRSYAPRWLIDVRTAPRFDMGAGSRAEVFKTIDQLSIGYVDLLGALGISDYQQVGINPYFLADSVSSRIAKPGATLTGPVMFLFDNPTLMDAAAAQLPLHLRPKPKDGWEVLRLTA